MHSLSVTLSSRGDLPESTACGCAGESSQAPQKGQKRLPEEQVSNHDSAQYGHVILFWSSFAVCRELTRVERPIPEPLTALSLSLFMHSSADTSAAMTHRIARCAGARWHTVAVPV